MKKRDACIESYSRLKNLKLVGLELGIPWQTVYVHLRAAGVPVTGDKSRYGSDTDRLAAKAEALFSELVPAAVNQNDTQFQAKVDFVVGEYAIDVKSARQRHNRWAFSLKKQELVADFFVCIAYNDDDTYRLLVIPGELCRFLQTISLAAKSRTKWWDYEIQASELAQFFEQVRAADESAAA